jgi:polyhydroxyalkanoate synthesis repressor PhaR
VQKKYSERLIKKYPNRRLYDTQTSSYITLTDVKQLVLDADEFTVVDAKTERRPDAQHPAADHPRRRSERRADVLERVLSQIIRYYGHAMQGMMGSYLEKNVQAFTDIQNKFVGSTGASKASRSARRCGPSS